MKTLSLLVALVPLFVTGCTKCAYANKDYATKVQSQGFVVTRDALRDIVADGRKEWRSSTYGELRAAPLSKPNYLVLRFNHPDPIAVWGTVLVQVSHNNSITQPIRLHVGPYWREYFIPLDSWTWGDPPNFTTDNTRPEVMITWTEIFTE